LIDRNGTTDSFPLTDQGPRCSERSDFCEGKSVSAGIARQSDFFKFSTDKA
jgi:hypothetical protein